MKKMQIILMAVLLAAGMGYSAILTNLTVNFTGQTAGLKPTGANLVEPVANTSTNFVQVVASSAIGSGEAVRIYDTSTNAGTGLHYNFVANEGHQVNAAGVKFQYTQRATLPAGGSTGAFSIQVGSYNTFAGTSNKIAELQVRNDTRVMQAFNGNPTTIIAAGNPLFVAGTVHTVELFVNDQDSKAVKYWQNGTEYSLAANSHIVYIDNVGYAAQSLNLAVEVDGGTVGTTEWNLGRLGFSTAGGVAGVDFEIDNIQVTDLIPEPATMGMLLLGAVTVLAVRRRRA